MGKRENIPSPTLSEPSEIGTASELSETVVCELSETVVCVLSETVVWGVPELVGSGDSPSARTELGRQTNSAKRQRRPPVQALKVVMTDDLKPGDRNEPAPFGRRE